jgi:uncharacterized repeat protein (TIGR01451 family)
VAGEDGQNMTRGRSLAVVFNILVCAALIASLAVMVITPQTAHAQSWPASWVLIDTDPDEAGPSNNYRDVWKAYFNFDDAYLYLRLETYAAPQFPAVGARFKWLIDTGIGPTLYWSGSNMLGSEYALFVEDSDNDGGRDVYLLDAQGDDRYSQYEPYDYKTDPGPILDPTVAGYRLDGNSVDLYVSLNALGVDSAADVELMWATDQENRNLEQGPTLDSTDVRDTPLFVAADLAVRKVVDDPNPSVDDFIIYTVRVTNSGPATATNIDITDLLPFGVSYQSHVASQGSYNDGTGIWDVGDLANAAFATLAITAQVTALISPNTNTATVTDVDQPDPDSGDNEDYAVIFPTEVAADLAVCKTVDDPRPDPGDVITYTVRLCNSGPSTATNVEVTDLLPTGVTYQTHVVTQGNYNDSTGLWVVGDLANANSVTLTITATVDLCPCGSKITNTATITAADQDDPHPSDNTDSADAFPFRVDSPPGGGPVPAFPSLHISIAAAFGAAILAYKLRPKLARQPWH